jgi:hypothetical protein
MIEEVRRANLEKTIDVDRHLKDEGNNSLYKRFADELHHHLIKTRRSLQCLFDFIEATVPDEHHQRKGVPYREERQRSVDSLVSFFIGMQKATSNIVKGGFQLNEQGRRPKLTADDLLGTMDRVMDEGKELVVYCESLGISPFDSEFFRRVLTTIGLEGFKKLVEDERYATLKIKPDLFRDAVLHQQGAEDFLKSKLHFVDEKTAELTATGEFDELAKAFPHIYVEAALAYREVKKGYNRYPFSNPYDYLLRKKKDYERAKEKTSKEKRKPGPKKRAAPEDVY